MSSYFSMSIFFLLFQYVNLIPLVHLYHFEGFGTGLPAFIKSYFSNSYNFSFAEAGSEVKAGG